jgi:hypothetical protein
VRRFFINELSLLTFQAIRQAIMLF